MIRSRSFFGEREDEDAADFLDLPADPHDSLVQVEVFQRQAEQLAFPHPAGGGQLGYGPQLIRVRGDHCRDHRIVPNLNVGCQMAPVSG